MLNSGPQSLSNPCPPVKKEPTTLKVHTPVKEKSLAGALDIWCLAGSNGHSPSLIYDPESKLVPHKGILLFNVTLVFNIGS